MLLEARQPSACRLANEILLGLKALVALLGFIINNSNGEQFCSPLLLLPKVTPLTRFAYSDPRGVNLNCSSAREELARSD